MHAGVTHQKVNRDLGIEAMGKVRPNIKHEPVRCRL